MPLYECWPKKRDAVIVVVAVVVVSKIEIRDVWLMKPCSRGRQSIK